MQLGGLNTQPTSQCGSWDVQNIDQKKSDLLLKARAQPIRWVHLRILPQVVHLQVFAIASIEQGYNPPKWEGWEKWARMRLGKVMKIKNTRQKKRGKIQIKLKYNSSTKANVLSVQQRKWPTDIKWMKDLLVVYSREKVPTENICPVIGIRFGDQLAQVHRGDYVSRLCEKGRSDK